MTHHPPHEYRVRSTPRQGRPQSLPQRLLPLMPVTGQRPLFGRQVREKAEASDAIGADSLAVNPRITSYKIPQVIPVEFPAMLEFVHEAGGIERIPRLPKLQDHEPPDERLIERPGCVNPEIINVARLVALIARADLFRENFRQGET